MLPSYSHEKTSMCRRFEAVIDISGNELSITHHNTHLMGSKNNTHFFYSSQLIPEDRQLPSILVHIQPNKALSHGKDIETLTLEHKRKFEKFLDGCINKVDEHHPAGSSIKASITCMHLS